MAKYPDWAPEKKKRATVWEREEPVPEAEEEPKQPEHPIPTCIACHSAMELWERGYLLLYQDFTGLGVRFSGTPLYKEAEVWICPKCGRYDFFRPMEVSVADRFEAFRRCSDEQLRAIAGDKLRSEEMRQAARTILERRGK